MTPSNPSFQCQKLFSLLFISNQFPAQEVSRLCCVIYLQVLKSWGGKRCRTPCCFNGCCFHHTCINTCLLELARWECLMDFTWNQVWDDFLTWFWIHFLHSIDKWRTMSFSRFNNHSESTNNGHGFMHLWGYENVLHQVSVEGGLCRLSQL